MLQINGRATWRQAARLAGTSESTVARRAQQHVRRRLHARERRVADPIRCGFGYPVLVQLSCEVGAAAEVAAQLAERPDVRFVALVTGTFDIVAELIVPSRVALARSCSRSCPRSRESRSTTTESVLRNFKTSYDWSRDLLGRCGADGLDRARCGRRTASRSTRSTCCCSSCSSRTAGARTPSSRAAVGDQRVDGPPTRRRARRRPGACSSPRSSIRIYSGTTWRCFIWMRVELARLEETAARWPRGGRSATSRPRAGSATSPAR